MASSRRTSLVVILAAAAIAVAAAVAVLVLGMHRSTSPDTTGATGPSGTPSPASLLAAGQAVYDHGVGPDGRPIPRTLDRRGGGMMGGGMGMMMGGGCASCHGADAHGRTTAQFTAPNITYANLTDARGMLMPDGSRDVTYTDAGLRAAITTGVDPDGGRLDWPMPQWQLNDQEWEGLLAYLKTLP